jgi:soluble lytic murein transglycosylase
MLTDLSSGRADDGERRLERIFRRWRSPAWKERATVALGVARLRRKEYDRSVKALTPVSTSPSPLGPFAALRRGEALTGAGRGAEAAKALEAASRVSIDPVLADDFVVARARALTASGSEDAAYRLLEDHLRSPQCHDRARVMDAAASLFAGSGDPAAAAAMDRRLWLEEPRSPLVGPAFERLSELLPLASRLRAADAPAVAARARELLDAGDGKGAYAGWERLRQSVPSVAADPRWRMEIAEAAVEARQPAAALALLGPVPVKRGETRRGWLLGRALFAMGRETQGAAALRTAAAGSDEAAAAAQFLLATSLDQNDHDREALDQFQAYVRRFHDEDRLDSAIWRTGWLTYRLARRDDAARWFETLLSRPGASLYHPSARYWLGRCRESSGKSALAVDAYTRLVAENARDYYGILALRRLAEMGRRDDPGGGAGSGPAPGAAADADDASGGPLGAPSARFCGAGGKSAPLVRIGCELERIGLFQDAEREYEAAASAEPSRELLLRLSEMAIRKGDRASAMARLKAAVPNYLTVPIPTLPRRYWEVLFPRTEWDSIETFAKAQKLDPYLVCGLILQESAFNPLAVSGAGARGLMQVLPGTGADAARALGVKSFNPARLFEPATNVRLGTWHFAGVLSRCDRRVDVALAAYNAGEARARHWQEVFGTRDSTQFVEEIPYIETRLYVKRILSHAAMYRAIYGS